MQPHHHIRVNGEMRLDLMMWLEFLHHPTVYSRPFMDFKEKPDVDVQSAIWSDASRNSSLRFGVICSDEWVFGQWDALFIKKEGPSIEYLEFFAVVAGILQWGDRFKNKSIVIRCDNKSVVDIINANSSSCKNCMVLLRIMILHALKLNIHVMAKHILGCDNNLSNALSRLQFNRFWALAKKNKLFFKAQPKMIPEEIWPMKKLWLKLFHFTISG